MKHVLWMLVLAAVLCISACTKESGPGTGEKKSATTAETPEAALKTAADDFCAATLKGDAETAFNFMYPPAMREKAAELAGFESVEKFLDNFKKMLAQEIKEAPMESCTIGEVRIKECPSFVKGHFGEFKLEVQQCGEFAVAMKRASEDEEETMTMPAGMVDGKWYAVLEDMDTGIDYSEDGENDMGLRDFAHDFCGAIEARDNAAIKGMLAGGIQQIASTEHPDITSWDAYMSRLQEAWDTSQESVSCSVMSTENYGECSPETTEAYAAAEMEAVTCGIIDIAVFIDDSPWSNSLSAVFIDGAWNIDPGELIEFSQIEN